MGTVFTFMGKVLHKITRSAKSFILRKSLRCCIGSTRAGKVLRLEIDSALVISEERIDETSYHVVLVVRCGSVVDGFDDRAASRFRSRHRPDVAESRSCGLASVAPDSE